MDGEYNNYKGSSSIRFNVILIFLFLILSIIAVFPFWHSGYLYSGPDMQFHLSRVQELVYSIKNGNLFPHIATYNFNQIGDFVISSYPWGTIYPFAIFMFIFKPVSAIYLGMTLYIFLALVFSYFSMFSISNSRRISFSFSLLYGYTVYFIYNVMEFQFGTFLAYPFIPLAIAGLYIMMFKDYRKWHMLTFGIVGVAYSHVPTTLILVFTLVLMYLSLMKFQPLEHKKERFKSILLALSISGLLSLVTFVPILVVMFHQNLVRPFPGNLSSGSEDVSHIINNNFINSGYGGGMGIIIFLLFIFGWIFVRKMSNIPKYAYLMGCLTMLLISNFFPWYIIHSIPLLNVIDGIQATHRIYPIAILFISVFGAYVFYYFHSQKQLKIVTYISYFIIIISVPVASVAGLNSKIDEVPLSYKATFNNHVPRSSFGIQDYKVDNEHYYDQLVAETASGVTDYVPIEATYNDNFTDISNHNALINGEKIDLTSDMSVNTDSIQYVINKYIKSGTEIDLPFLKYNNLNYQVMVNGQIVNYTKSNRATISFYSPINSNKLKVEIHFNSPIMIKVATFVSILTWIVIILGLLIPSKLKNKILRIRRG